MRKINRIIPRNNVPFPKAANYEAVQSDPPISVRSSLSAVNREDANIEAEGGETVHMFGEGGFPRLYDINGPRHSQGGVPLNLPDKAFVFSDYKTKLKIKDPNILKLFGKGGDKSRKGYTPADLSKQYNVNEYLKILSDPDSTKIQKDTAERMIKNYNTKLGQLALVQESMKGFPDGIPDVAFPYLYNVGIDPATILPVDQEAMGQQPIEQEYEEEEVPMAQYGMQVAPMTRDISIPVMQKGGPQKGDIEVDYLDDEYALDARVAEAQKQYPNKTVYVRYPDGTYKLIKGKAAPRSKYSGQLNLGKGIRSYEKLDYVIRNDANLQNEIYNNYLKEIDKKPSRLTDAQKKRLKAKSRKEVIDNFLKFQEQVYAINSSDIDKDDEAWDKGGSNKNKKYTEAATKLGFDPLDEDGIAMGQAAYWGAFDAAKKPEFNYLAKQFQLGYRGTSDEPDPRSGRVSPVDGVFGNTTNRQGIFSLGEYDMIDLGVEEEKRAADPTRGASPQYSMRTVEPEWWTQNLVNLAGRVQDWASIKKYYPDLFNLDLQEPSPTFISPERGLAAIAEQQNIAGQALGAFSGPQATSARMSQIVGQGAKAATDYLSQIQNQNVGIANQFEMAQKQILNQETQYNTESRRRFHDQLTVMNQQYDNAKRATRAGMENAYNAGLTAAQQTAAMNVMYPHYQVDPTTGQVYFYQGSDLTGETPSTNPQLEAYIKALRENPDVDPNALASFFTGKNQSAAASMFPNPMQGYQDMMGYYGQY